MSTQHSLDDTFNILVATDNHLGYAEREVIKGNDSFDTFEEILQLAVKHNVDMVLLGGDLFHEANPSSYSLSKCIQLLKQYCVGDKPVAIQYLSDPSVNFPHLKNPIVNYEDPTLNISFPLFSIHGNHDDPTGLNQISALDILANTGLVNYFGRQDNLTDVVIKPLLMAKGHSKLAIYGLSHLRDERLGRLFLNRQIAMDKPEGDDWFHLMVLHQNRAARGPKNFVPTSFLPDYLNLVIWGHEHDCYIDPVQSDELYITQPGSSVATSLAEGESRPKHVGLLQINKKEFKLIPIPLQTVRPFLYKELHLNSPDSSLYDKQNPSVQAMINVENELKELLKDCAAKNAGTVRENMLPLIRIIVYYKDSRQAFNSIKFNQQFINKIANPKDAVLLKLYKDSARKQQKSSNQRLECEEGEDCIIEDLIREDFSTKSMSALSVTKMLAALQKLVTARDTDAIRLDIDEQKKDVLEKLVKKDPNEDEIDKTLLEIMNELNPNDTYQPRTLDKTVNNGVGTGTSKINKTVVIADPNSDDDMTMQNITKSNSDDDMDLQNQSPKKRGRPSSRGRKLGQRSGSSSGPATSSSPGQSRGRGRPRGRGRTKR